MEKIIRQNETATISLKANRCGVSVKVLLFNGKVFEGSFAQATPQMNFPATHTHYVADPHSNLPITKEASEIILAEMPKIQAQWDAQNRQPLRRTYTDEWTGETKYLDDAEVAEEEDQEVKAIRSEISELTAQVEYHNGREETREEGECRNRIFRLREKIKSIKGVN